MSDEWQLPVPSEDPEGRKPPVGGGSGCPIVPDGNFVEGGMAEGDGAEFGRPDSASTGD